MYRVVATMRVLNAAKRIDALIKKTTEEVRERRGRSSEDQVMALLGIGVMHGLVANLQRTERFSREDMDGIDILFTDTGGPKRLQVKSSRRAAMEFATRGTGIPVIWTGKSSAETIAMQLARIFPSLKTLPKLLKRREE